MKQRFNDNWLFAKTSLDVAITALKETDFSPVEIPHDWLIYDTLNLYEDSIGWYKKTFDIEMHNQTEDYVEIEFEGVYMDTTVYLNGTLIGTWKYGYSTFRFDITQQLILGENQLLVRVVHQHPNSRWYSGAGIYRNVYLDKKKQTRFISDGIYITPVKKEDGRWDVEVEAQVCSDVPVKVTHGIIDVDGVLLCQKGRMIDDFEQDFHEVVFSVASPRLWGIHDGQLYTLKSVLTVEGEVVDEVIQTFGFRTISMSPKGGLVLNGERIKLYGVCQHHDLGALGAATNIVALRRQFTILKEMGTNAIRTAHNMPSRAFMQVADEMGFLICSESFDMWRRQKTTYDYGRFFDEWAQIDIASWVRRDRNCPSVFMWCIGNEIYDTHGDESAVELTKQLKEWVQMHDKKGHGVVTIGSNFMTEQNAQKCTDVLGYAGYNYAEKLYASHHEMYPDWVIYGSETSSTVQSRGVYKFPLAHQFLSDDDEQCSSLGNSTVSWGARNTEGCILDDRDHGFSLGQFIWTGFDYIGEPTPYHTKNAYFGQVDTAGFKKDTFYIYQSAWTSYKTAPMVHIFPYWDFDKGELIDVRVATNAPTVELFFNEISLGIHETHHETGHDIVGHWQIPYEIGVLKAVAYDERGRVVKTDVKKSFGDAEEIVLTADKTVLKANGEDLVFLVIEMTDEMGEIVANANNRVCVAVTGAGRLVGLDNGDSTDNDSYKGTSRRLFSGKLLAIIGATHDVGEIDVTVTSVGLPDARMTLMSEFSPGVIGVSQWLAVNKTFTPCLEVPIRKVALRCEEGVFFTPAMREKIVDYELFPKDATYGEVSWRVTDVGAAEAVNATYEVLEGNKIKVKALGDGVFYLRCDVKNGGEKTKSIFSKRFVITGLGDAYLNPYRFISGSLYTSSNTQLGPGNQRGVVTDGEEGNLITFARVDFGKVGADTLHLPLFIMGETGTDVTIYASDEKVGTVHYDLSTIWDTYQAVTVKLKKRLTGLQHLTFEFNKKLQFKGFEFEKISRGYDKNSALTYDYLSGDSYEVALGGLVNIGNNVAVRFNDMDFSAGTSWLDICGATSLSENVIRIEFSNELETLTRMVTFKQAQIPEVQRLKFDGVIGMYDVTFIFLPGCRFDFEWFLFG